MEAALFFPLSHFLLLLPPPTTTQSAEARRAQIFETMWSLAEKMDRMSNSQSAIVLEAKNRLEQELPAAPLRSTTRRCGGLMRAVIYALVKWCTSPRVPPR
jgi:hypothetical protein